MISTKYGLLEGVPGEGCTVYKGIPYARAPIGERRWRKPQPPEAWEGVFHADHYGCKSIQFGNPRDTFYKKEFYSNPAFDVPVSEDCLYLNICSGAENAGEKRPVYVWYHGGGLTNCYAYEPQFNPQVLAKKGIVVVTVAQRLNVFGYLVLPQFDAEQDGHGGNYGFMDQVKALDWITENCCLWRGS